MDSKRKMYIIIIAVAAAVLVGLIVLAIALNARRSADGTETTGGQKETVSQSAADTTAEDVNDPSDETTLPENSTGETAETTQATEADGTKPSSSDGGKNNDPDKKPESKPGTEPSTEPGTEPGTEPDDEPSKPTTPAPTNPAPTEPTLPDVYPYNVTWEEYNAMTEQEQIAFYKDFKNHKEYKAWYSAAKAAYEETRIELEIGEDGKIDLSPITGKN